MSLINEALKKAQRQRSGENVTPSATAGANNEPAVRIIRREKPVGFNSFVIRLALGLGVLALVVIGGVFTVRFFTETAPEKSITSAATTPIKPTEPLAAKAEDSFKVPVVTPASSASAQAEPATNSASTLTPSAATTILPVEIKLPPPPTPVGPARMDTKTIAVIEGLRIAGIRASASDSKVLMNDRVYRAGDTIDHELGLKLVEIAPSALTFQKENGSRYTRNF
ncbi:hypothetical protein [Oleiharenicola lentus]|uniref:hypothetical protein n=1 Tax=Oleiharenicola lentus TaxID=2508720 RepID=UPI003F665EC5